MKVKNKIVVVTGGGSGIGRSLVLSLLAKGARVAAVDINGETLAETAVLAKTHANHLSTHILNVTDKTAVENLPQQVIDAHGTVDIVINNAGIIQPFVRVNDLEYSSIERVMDVNFYGLVYMTKTFLPHLKQRPEAHLVNISSMGGYLPVPGQTIYGASKAAVKLFTEGLRSELLETNVHVTVVFPGAIGTNISVNSGVDMGVENLAEAEQESSFKPLPSNDAAEIIVRGIEKDKSRIFVGSDAKMMDFLYRVAPTFAANFIYKQMKSLL